MDVIFTTERECIKYTCMGKIEGKDKFSEVIRGVGVCAVSMVRVYLNELKPMEYWYSLGCWWQREVVRIGASVVDDRWERIEWDRLPGFLVRSINERRRVDILGGMRGDEILKKYPLTPEEAMTGVVGIRSYQGLKGVHDGE